MARINLLPWRAERRKQRQQEFMGLLGLSALVAVMISLVIVMYYKGQIEGQKARNVYLQDQIKLVNEQIKEIEELDKKKARLLRRKEVIEELQASRSQMVHLFDELVRTIPDGLRLNSIRQQGNDLSLQGFAQSNARVSTYMRNLQVSGWMTKPELSIIEVKNGDPGLPYSFSLKVTLKNPQDSEAQNGTAPATDVAAAPVEPATAAPAGTTPAAPAGTTPAPAATPAAPAAAPATPPAPEPETPAATPTTGGSP
jgi:type IV pilus assembly protein PilN